MIDDELPPPDPRLRQALRHAPDAAAEPPAALSARILDEARRAVARPRWWRGGWQDRWLDRCLDVWRWSARPAGAAAMASVLLAGFIGLMWRGGPPPEALPDARAPDAVVAERGQGAPAEAPATVAAPPPAAAEAEAPPALAKASPSRRSAEPEAEPEIKRQRGPESKIEADRAVGAADLPAPRPAAPPQPRPAPARQAALAEDGPAAQPGARSMADAVAPAANAASAPVHADPLAPVLARLRVDAPPPPAWAELQALTRGRWSLEGPGGTPASAQRIESADGTLLGWLQWQDAALVFQAAHGGPRWRAPLAPADATRLRQALSR